MTRISVDIVQSIVRKLRDSARTVALRNKLRRDSRFRPSVGDGQIEILFNFPDGETNLYQIRQWYEPLEHLAKTHKVGILCYRPESALQVASETHLKVILTPSFSDLSEVEHVLKPKVILYPNQNYANYRILGLSSAEHIFVCHGESDKIYMASNWVKIFNYFFVAGRASRDRLSRHVRNYDVEDRTIEIGRPQVDSAPKAPITRLPGKRVVLYAPTWEGGRLSMKYGSVASHGTAVIRALMADERFQIIYRPHPRTGIHDETFADSDHEIRQLLSAQPDRGHFVDATPFGWQLAFADIMVTDISAVAYDWLTTAKPLIVTKPDEPSTVMPLSGFMVDSPLFESADAHEIVEVIERTVADEDLHRATLLWADYYYGDRSPGASTQRFVAAVERVIRERDLALQDEADIDVEASGREEALCQSRSSVDAPSTPATVLRSILRYFDAATTSIANTAASSRDRDFTGSSYPFETIDVLVSTMAGPREVDQLIDWLPVLRQLHEYHPVAILVGNRRTYETLSRRSDLNIYIGRTATATEETVAALNPKISLQFEQANLNLRETTYRNLTHVYVGSPDNRIWINNRLRLFDAVVVPAASYVKSVHSALINFPPSVNVYTYTQHQDLAAARLSAIERILADVDATASRSTNA